MASQYHLLRMCEQKFVFSFILLIQFSLIVYSANSEQISQGTLLEK